MPSSQMPRRVAGRTLDWKRHILLVLFAKAWLLRRSGMRKDTHRHRSHPLYLLHLIKQLHAMDVAVIRKHNYTIHLPLPDHPQGVEAHAVLGGVAVGPFKGHAVREGDVDEGETGACKEGRGAVGGAAGLDDEPGERVGHVAEGVEEAGEVERLERAGVGRGDDEHLARLPDAVPPALLLLHALHDPVRPHHLDGIRVRPRPDPYPVPAHNDMALRAPGRRRVPRRVQRGVVVRVGRGRVPGGGEGQGEGVGGGGGGSGGGGGGGDGAEDGGGLVVGGGVERAAGEEQEEEEPGEAEPEEEGDEAAERVEQEPEGGRGGGRVDG